MQKLKRMNVIRQLYTTILEKKMTDDEEVRHGESRRTSQ